MTVIFKEGKFDFSNWMDILILSQDCIIFFSSNLILPGKNNLIKAQNLYPIEQEVQALEKLFDWDFGN
jgi:hypothetical protein